MNAPKVERKWAKKGSREVVERYCPHVGDNVIMYRSMGVEPSTFECIRKNDCDGAERYKCK
ncbi:MAG TPA: hypothetical protein PK778_08955 [Bacillota bacterium]|nr:hypothetical protein [Clostridiales bacterium]HPT86104.1 hypothetical protein [Bacillota bacterium]